MAQKAEFIKTVTDVAAKVKRIVGSGKVPSPSELQGFVQRTVKLFKEKTAGAPAFFTTPIINQFAIASWDYPNNCVSPNGTITVALFQGALKGILTTLSPPPAAAAPAAAPAPAPAPAPAAAAGLTTANSITGKRGRDSSAETKSDAVTAGSDKHGGKLKQPKLFDIPSRVSELFNAIKQLELPDLSDPTELVSLKFPYCGDILPIDRFDFQQGGDFVFMGRERFQSILNTIQSAARCKVFNVYGSIGFGKSHLLAAIAVRLMRDGKRVVYVPDCGAMLKNPLSYLRWSMLLAFGDDSDVQRLIVQVNSLDDMAALCNNLSPAFIIVDQYNSLEDNQRDSGPMQQQKADARSLFDQLSCHIVVRGASANNDTAVRMQQKQRSECDIELFGGLSPFEMDQWLEHFQPQLPEMDDVELNMLKDVTGCVPLFLHGFLLQPGDVEVCRAQESDSEADVASGDSESKPTDGEGGGLNRATLQSVWPKIAGRNHLRAIAQNLEHFVQSFIDNGQRYVLKVLKQFVIETNFASGWPALYDHRYFFVVGSQCRSLCGWVRRIAAELLREHESHGFCTDDTWMNAIKLSTNPSVRGFLVEEVCLSAIMLNGLPLGTRCVRPSRVVRFYAKEEARALASENCVLYVPHAFNYKDVDALIREKLDDDEVLIIPIQVTLASTESHKKSVDSFFSRSQVWAADAPSAQWAFCWMIPRSSVGGRASINHDEVTRASRKRGQYQISPAFTEFFVACEDVASTLKIPLNTR